jgi:hypothetical protein
MKITLIIKLFLYLKSDIRHEEKKNEVDLLSAYVHFQSTRALHWPLPVNHLVERSNVREGM